MPCSAIPQMATFWHASSLRCYTILKLIVDLPFGFFPINNNISQDAAPKGWLSRSELTEMSSWMRRLTDGQTKDEMMLTTWWCEMGQPKPSAHLFMDRSRSRTQMLYEQTPLHQYTWRWQNYNFPSMTTSPLDFSTERIIARIICGNTCKTRLFQTGPNGDICNA